VLGECLFGKAGASPGAPRQRSEEVRGCPGVLRGEGGGYQRCPRNLWVMFGVEGRRGCGSSWGRYPDEFSERGVWEVLIQGDEAREDRVRAFPVAAAKAAICAW